MKEADILFKQKKFCILSTFPPRECGIAEFTRDFAKSMDLKFNPRLKSKIIAINEDVESCNYSDEVIMQINQKDIENYINIAKRINHDDNIKLVNIQHEFGLFGGEQGNHIIPFLETLEKPSIVTFHSVVPDPDDIRRKVVRYIASKCSAIVVMAEKAVDILCEDFGLDRNKIHVVYHGIPNVQMGDPKQFKERLNLKDHTVLSTFGLLSEGKGQQYAIKSLPYLVEKYPDLLYLIIGETHPIVKRHEGEEFRNMLIDNVNELGLKDYVRFYNQYLPTSEILDYLRASDIYMFTNLDKHQIVSGTLSYALSCGKAVVANPVACTREMLACGRGFLAKYKNPKSLAEGVDKILSDKQFRTDMENSAYAFSRRMTWSNVAARYLNIFNRIVRLREEVVEKYPPIKLNHLKNLTDEKGCIQFSRFTTPNKESGYTTDDNARALIVTVLYNNLLKSKHSRKLSHRYLNFLEKMQDKNGWFYNLTKQDKVLESYSEDHFGRALWALGFTLNKSRNLKIAERAEKLLNKSIHKSEGIRSLRARAFCINGLHHCYLRSKNPEDISKIINHADSLVNAYEHESDEGWHWFENKLTYSNAKLPEALFFAYDLTKNQKYLEVAEKTLRFLSELLFFKGYLTLVGQNGWYNRNGERAFFDQQPLDASSMVQTYLTAYNTTGKKEYYKKAVLSFNWFLGKNHLNQMVYDDNTGGCYDGLCKDSLNLNQGAESTISYLLARLFLEEAKRK